MKTFICIEHTLSQDEVRQLTQILSGFDKISAVASCNDPKVITDWADDTKPYEEKAEADDSWECIAGCADECLQPITHTD